MKHKILYMWIFFAACFVQRIQGEDLKQEIYRADSLFKSQNYPQALHQYQHVFTHSGQYTLAMLLKMAFISEIQGDRSMALYYLNVFYKDQPDKAVLAQMELLAERYNLQGYRYTDLEYFISLYNEYYYYIIVYILSGSCAVFLYLLYKKFKRRKLGLRPLIFIFILMTVYYITNYRITPPRAIIANNNTVLMAAPSAASEMVNITGEGHRVTLNGKKDIWYKITWDGVEAYIREDNLHLIPQRQKSLF